MRVGDFGVEGADGDEHDGRHEGAEDVLDDHEEEVGSGKRCQLLCLDGRGKGCLPSCTPRRECHDDSLRKHRRDQSAHESPTPDSYRLVLLTPFAGIVA